MKLVTVAEFAKEKGFSQIYIYKLISEFGVNWVRKKDGVKKPFALYYHDELEKMFVNRRKNNKQLKINVSKLW